MKMAAHNIDVAPVQQSRSPIPVPSQAWCMWQALKGTNPRRLKIPDVDLSNKWILLTGGNSGVGWEAALQFVKWGANIVLGCRQPPPHEMHPDVAVQKLKEAAVVAGYQNAVIEWWECDMSSLKSVEAFGKRWLATSRPLDILANNAGMGGVLGHVRYTQDCFEIVHQVWRIFILIGIMEPNLSLGKLHFSCPTHHDLASLSGTSFATPDYLHNVMYAIFWNLRLGKRKLRQKRISK
jgi:NAD(P)-dependent dehydrogenase (short-subunit alcohol dehydrogenase family)